MGRRTVKIGPLAAAALLACLGACGGGDGGAGDGQASIPMGTENNITSVLSGASGQASPGQSGLPALAPGFKAEVYSAVPEPMKLSFGTDGALYVGRQGGVRIHRVAPGGGSVAEFGPAMVDPDAVLFDACGRISGVPNSVLVGGGGVLAAIFPDQTAAVIFNAGFADVDDMQFDCGGRLVFSDDNPQVLVSTGQAPTVLFTTPSRPHSIAIDDDKRIFVALADGTIRIYNADGSLADPAFATGLAGFDTYLAFGPGEGGFGRALYVLNGSELLRFTRRGKSRVIGSGFDVGPPSGTGFVFGPDNALYVSEYNKNRILRISAATVTATATVTEARRRAITPAARRARAAFLALDLHWTISDKYFAQSDNQAMADHGIPSHTVSVAYAYPDYHGAGDHADKIDYDNMAAVNRAMALAIATIANNPEAPKWNAANPKAAAYLKTLNSRNVK